MNNEIKVNTRFNKDIIESEIDYGVIDTRQQVVKNIIKLQEQGVRDALIALGWTPPVEKTSTYFIVWNEHKTEGFITTDEQIAYEVRKGSDSNCFDVDGNESKLGRNFCHLYSCYEDCTIQKIEVTNHEN